MIDDEAEYEQRRQIRAQADADVAEFIASLGQDEGSGVPPPPTIKVSEVSSQPVELDFIGFGNQASGTAPGKPGASSDPAPWACCLPDSSCEMLTAAACAEAGGVFHVGQTCDPSPCCPVVSLVCDYIAASCSKCGIREYASPFMAFYKTMVVDLDAVYEQATPISPGLYSFRHEHLASSTTFTYTPDCPCPSYDQDCSGSFDFFSELRGDLPPEGDGHTECTSTITGCSGYFSGCASPFTTCNPPLDYWKHFGTTNISGNPLPYYTFSDGACIPSLEIYTGCFESAPNCTIPGPLTATSATTATYSVHRHVESDPVEDFLDVTWDLNITLSDEDTTDDLIARTEAAMPSYPDTWDGSCSASRDLADDESSYTIQRFKPKFTIASPVDYNLVICYNEHFVPDVGDPVDTPKTVTIPAGETEIVGDEILEPDTDGEITITDILNSCANPGDCA